MHQQKLWIEIIRGILSLTLNEWGLFDNLTLWGKRKLQFFYAEILPEFKNRPMPKIENAIYKQIIKVK